MVTSFPAFAIFNNAISEKNGKWHLFSLIFPIENINIENVVIRHMDLVWNVNFDEQVISGEATLRVEIVAKEIERIVS